MFAALPRLGAADPLVQRQAALEGVGSRATRLSSGRSCAAPASTPSCPTAPPGGVARSRQPCLLAHPHCAQGLVGGDASWPHGAGDHCRRTGTGLGLPVPVQAGLTSRCSPHGLEQVLSKCRRGTSQPPKSHGVTSAVGTSRFQLRDERALEGMCGACAVDLRPAGS